MDTGENNILFHQHVLLISTAEENSTLDQIKQNFLGGVITDLSDYPSENNGITYVCGDVSKVVEQLGSRLTDVKIVKDLSFNYGEYQEVYPFITSGQIPLNINNVGVYFPQAFQEQNVFETVQSSHHFHVLKQSSKPSEAYRTGVYISPVEATDRGIETFLLRCSTNFPNHPTENFTDIDRTIVGAAQSLADNFFNEKVSLNHVLAQIYWNKTMTKDSGKLVERKAKIIAHSDKTKDMPRNAVMAFCTFYEGYDGDSFPGMKHIKKSKFDFTYRGRSVLTQLLFRSKTGGEDFTVTLYPNSLFIVPLSTNRLYLHETVPSTLPSDMIPTRMGYVIRCSSTKAVYTPDPHIVDDGQLVPMHPITDDERAKLALLYFQENATTDIIRYRKFYSSMNEGDYVLPVL